MNLQSINASASPEVGSNNNFATLSWAGAFGRKPSTSGGLVWGYYGCDDYLGNTVADGTLTLTDDDDNYIVVLRSTGVVSASTATTNSLDPLYARLYKVTTASGLVTAIVDERLKANGLFAPPAAGTGTVTHTGGALTSNAVVLGAGTDDAKVVAGINTDGTSVLTLGEAGTSVGGLALKNATSGSITVNPPTGALGTVTLTLPAATDTLVGKATTDTLTNKTLTSPTLTTPALGTPASGNLSSCTADGTNAVGFRTIPQNSQSAAYTTVAADSGKHILHPSGDANARTFTIDSNANVAYPVGTAITFVNQTSQVVTIAITSDTLTLAGTTTTGSRSLAQNGVATALKVTSTSWIISGTGLS